MKEGAESSTLQCNMSGAQAEPGRHAMPTQLPVKPHNSQNRVPAASAGTTHHVRQCACQWLAASHVIFEPHQPLQENTAVAARNSAATTMLARTQPEHHTHDNSFTLATHTLLHMAQPA